MRRKALTNEDGEVLELTAEDFANAKPISEVFPEIAQAQKEGKLETRAVGRPKQKITKDRITIRLSPEVTEYFRSHGKGWQSEIDDILKKYVKRLSLK